jgi:uncharacterized protein
MAKHRIITFDGGGILGAFTTRLLERLWTEVPDMLDGVDLLAGTSVGGLIASSLALGFTPRELMLFYRPIPLIDAIFLPYPTTDPPRRGDTLPLMDNPLAVLQRILRVDIPLKAIPRRLLVTTMALKGADGSWGPVFMNNFPGSPTGDVSVVDAVLRSTAAPIYWPTTGGFVDGWVVANNPCMAAVAAAVDPSQGGQLLADLRVMSFGVGRPTQFVDGQDLAWGRSQWFGSTAPATITPAPLLDMLFWSSSEVPARYCAQLLGADRFLRVNAAMRPIALNDVGAIEELIGLADAVDLTPYLDWIRANWS